MKRKMIRGFTLIELLVVIAIVSLLASFVITNLSSARPKAMNAKRRQDMHQIRVALEEYYSDHNGYPLAGPIGNSSWGGVSAGSCGSADGTTSGANAYVQGLIPNYMTTLPVDPDGGADCTGYLYYSDGANYKLLALQTSLSYPSEGQAFYDPVRPTWALMMCSDNVTACNTW